MSDVGRFTKYVRPLELVDHACWIWDGYLSSDGYGRFWHRGGQLAHRFAYQLFIGPIGSGLVVDHLCRVRRCVNPGHMEVIPREENTRRGWRDRNPGRGYST